MSTTKTNTFIALLSLLLLTGSQLVMAQSTYEPSEQRSDFQSRKKSIMDGNDLRASYFNYGISGKPNNLPDELRFEFPKNTGREYMHFMFLMFGTEITKQNVVTGGSTRAIVDVADFRTSPSDQSYSLNPITGYARDDSDEMARSDRGPTSVLGNTWPNTWPDKLEESDGWAGSWNGYFGRDQFNADLEFYYRAGDDQYTRFIEEYKPDETDATRGGLGIILDTRIMSWSQTLLSAVHFNIFEITNDASYDYEQFAFGLWIADLIAGTSSNDIPQFDDIRAIAYLTDGDRDAPPPIFEGTRVGEMGLKFLETPGNAIDGIDNDADSETYLPGSDLYVAGNNDLYTSLTTLGGGFYSSEALRDTVIPRFVAEDFAEVSLNPGDKIVLIGENDERIVTTYPIGGGTVVSQGRSINLPASGLTVTEDFLPIEHPNHGSHVDGIDNDFDGLIDESTPNHLTKTTFINNNVEIVAVRHINYLSFEPGDTLKRGLIVPNSVIRARMDSDPDFELLVNETFDGRFQNYHTSAPMIDEARDDYFDNENDWVASSDDVGIEGDPDAVSVGQGDGKPTSGAGTSFPGESSIDKTDVSESDGIGVTRATIFAAGLLNVDDDNEIWNEYLVPGDFARSGEPNTDSDIFISSGLFPLRRGATERFAVAITAAQKNGTAQQDRDQINRNLDEAQKAYETDYQFARAPNPPLLSAKVGNGYVTLHWDNSSEDSYDRYLDKITGNGNDFEGYRVYKATDPSFEDAKIITDSYGGKQFYKPEVTYDIINGITGFHPVPVNGTQYEMGNDSGLQYTWTDTDVENGKQYFYAVTGFDYGAEIAGIAPSESPIQISLQPNGSYNLGQNVVTVTPTPSQAGLVSPENPAATIISGSPGGTVEVQVVDPSFLTEESVYQVVFEDTLVPGANSSLPDTVKTKNFSLIDVTTANIDTLIDRSTNLNGENNLITDGFTIFVQNETELGINDELTRWHQAGDDYTNHNFQVVPANTRQPVADYEIVFGELGYGMSSDRQIERTIGQMFSFPAVPTNFRVFNTYTDEEVEYAYYGFPRSSLQAIGTEDVNAEGEFGAFLSSRGAFSDNIYLIEDFNGEEKVATYRIRMNAVSTPGSTLIPSSSHPRNGDTLKIAINKPFLANDVFEFRIAPENTEHIDEELAKSQMEEIYVAPNPYVVSSPFEKAITNTDNNQHRALYFVGIPVPSTIRIFSVSGTVIETIHVDENDGNLVDTGGGSYRWDMLSKDNLEISYGIYYYHIDAPGIGEKTGKFAVIK